MCRMQGPLWTAAKVAYSIIILRCSAHTWNTSSHFIPCCFKSSASRRHTGWHTHAAHYMTFSTPRSDIVPRGVLWRNLTVRPDELQLEPWMSGISTLRDMFLSPDACVLDLQASGQLKGFVSDVLVNLTHTHSPASLLMIPWLQINTGLVCSLGFPFLCSKKQCKNH